MLDQPGIGNKLVNRVVQRNFFMKVMESILKSRRNEDKSYIFL